MKNISPKTVLLSLVLLIAALLILPLFGGCATTNPDTLARVTLITRSVARTGTAATLLSRPDYRPQIEQVEAGLSAAIAADQGDLTTLMKLLGGFPGGELSGEQGTLVISGGVVLYETLAGLYWQPESRQATMAFMTAIRDGIREGLGSSTVSIAAAAPKAKTLPPLLPTRHVGNTRKL